MNEVQVSLTLNVGQVNVILSALGQLPYVQVAALIGMLKAQAEEQVKAVVGNTE